MSKVSRHVHATAFRPLRRCVQPEKLFKPGSPEEGAEIERVAGLILDGARDDLRKALNSLHQMSSEVENSEQVGPRILEAIHRLHASNPNSAESGKVLPEVQPRRNRGSAEEC